MKKLVSALVLVVLWSGYASAQTVVNVGSKAAVIRELTILKTADLSFGRLSKGAGAGSVSFPGATPVGAGSVVVVSGGSLGQFQLSGTPRLCVNINFNRNALSLARQGGPETLVVNSLENRGSFGSCNTNGIGTGGAVVLDGSGAGVVTLKGVLDVPETAVAGVYSAILPISAQYQ
jgi:hypothetical protein